MFKGIRWLLTAILLLLLSSRAPGQTDYRVAPVALQHGMWRFTPLYHVTPNGVRVDQLVGFALPDTTFGDNVVAVLYVWSDQDGWSCKAWPTTDRAAIVKDLKLTYSIPASDDELWELADPEALVAAVRAENKDFTKGFFSDDPLSAVLNTPATREVVVEWLKDAGAPVAVVDIDKPGDQLNLCRTFYLNWVKTSAESAVTRYLSEVAAGDPNAPPPGTTPPPGNPVPIVPNQTNDPCMFLPPDQGDVPALWLNNNCFSFWYYKPMTYNWTITCGAWGMFVKTATATITITLPVAPGFTFPPAVTETCYTRNCSAFQTAIISWYDWCTRSMGSYHVFRTLNYKEECCVSGLGGPPPPVPCTPAIKMFPPSPWTTTPPPGITPFPGDGYPGNSPRP
ncbi:MAG: hypothetical protein K2Q09_01760 [Phycisphaerales bacterium]|nr:hypothetical protein [Phycisphaerales bacterium]